MTELTPEEQIIELNRKFEEEMGEWEKIGVDPNTVINFNPFRIDTWVQALTLFLTEKEIIVENEFVVFLKNKQIETLGEMRIKITEAMRKARLEGMGIEVPNMTVPKGNVRKLH